MLQTILLIPIILIINCCSSNEVSNKPSFQEYIQTEDETADRIKHNCPAIMRRICKNKKKDCVQVYISDKTKKECQAIDKIKIERTCDTDDVVLYKTEKECLNIREPENCEKKITKTFDAKNLYKCETLYKKICLTVCGKRYDKTDVRKMWPNDYSVVCLDEDTKQIKNGVTYRSDRVEHGCYTDAERHIAAGGTRTWCVKYDYVYNWQKLGAYLQCASRLK